MFTVFGERLDVVLSPQILFTVSSSKKRQTVMVHFVMYDDEQD